MPRHIEHHDSESVSDFSVLQDLTVLPTISASGVKADQRNALPGLLPIEAMGPPADLEMAVTPCNRFDFHTRPRNDSSISFR